MERKAQLYQALGLNQPKDQLMSSLKVVAGAVSKEIDRMRLLIEACA